MTAAASPGGDRLGGRGTVDLRARPGLRCAKRRTTAERFRNTARRRRRVARGPLRRPQAVGVDARLRRAGVLVFGHALQAALFALFAVLKGLLVLQAASDLVLSATG